MTRISKDDAAFEFALASIFVCSTQGPLASMWCKVAHHKIGRRVRLLRNEAFRLVTDQLGDQSLKHLITDNARRKRIIASMEQSTLRWDIIPEYRRWRRSMLGTAAAVMSQQRVITGVAGEK